VELARAERLLREAGESAASLVASPALPEEALRTSIRHRIEATLNRLEQARRRFTACRAGPDPAAASRGIAEADRTIESLYRLRERLDRADAEGRRR
jgi:hypothetical protein